MYVQTKELPKLIFFTQAKKNYPSSARLARYIFHVWGEVRGVMIMIADSIFLNHPFQRAVAK